MPCILRVFNWLPSIFDKKRSLLHLLLLVSTLAVEAGLKGLNAGTILLVEDDSNDVLSIQRAFQKVGPNIHLTTVPDGEQAIGYLKGEGAYADRMKFPIPALILLDLSMPRVNGFEVLEWLRKQEALRHLPVIVLTTSVYAPDVQRAYRTGANSFVVKAMDWGDFTKSIKEIVDFWLVTCVLPQTPVVTPPRANDLNRLEPNNPPST